MFAKICDKLGDDGVGEGIAAKKTGLPKVTIIHSNNENPKEYYLN